MKKIQIGARVSEEDAEFLNLLDINGAKTPSDKLRAIIEEARLRREYSNDFSGILRMVHEQVAPLTERIKKAEYEHEAHSAPLARILEWLPEFCAYSLSYLPEDIESKDVLVNYERGTVDRVARLFESLLHLELSSQENSYSEGSFRTHVEQLAELIRIIHATSQKKEG